MEAVHFIQTAVTN